MSNGPFDFARILSGLGRLEHEEELREAVDRLARRVRECEERSAALIALASDPEQAHRMITRKEIVRTLRGEALA